MIYIDLCPRGIERPHPATHCRLLGILILLCLTSISPSLAGVIKGRALDQSRQPIEFANVAVFVSGDSAPTKGTIADAAGNFLIDGIKDGRYTVRISYIGYKPIEQVVNLSSATQHTADLKTLILREDSEVLSEVNVTAQKAAMRLEVDKRVFDVASSIASAGLSATEALENIPSVEVDQEGNISLRGSSSVTVWINGKAQGLTSDNRGDILQQLPAESIDRIEVITNPSSKYSPEGSAGIINIILKRDRKAGYYGGVQLSLNKQQDYSPLGGRMGANINYSSGILEAYANVGVGRRQNKGGGWTDRDYIDPESDVAYGYLNQKNVNRMRRTNIFVRGGVTWHPTTKDEIGINYMTMQGLDKSKRTTDYNYVSGLYDTEEALDLLSARPDLAFSPYVRNRYSRNGDKPHMQHAGVTYRHEWKTGHTLDASFSLGMWSSDNETSYDQTTIFPSSGSMSRDEAPGLNDEASRLVRSYQTQETNIGNRHIELQIDYERPMGEQGKLETGYKGTLAHENSPTETWSDEAHQQSVYLLYNRFIYDQNIQAFYANYQNKIGQHFGYQVGLRAEYWKVETESHDYDMEYGTNHFGQTAGYTHPAPYSKDFFRLFPTVFLSYTLPHDQELQFNYTRRLQRPWGGQMNSFKNISDSTSISYGYPGLTPAYTNSFELNYLKTWEDHTLSASAYYRPTSDVIQSIAYMEEGIRYSTQRNIAKEQSSGLEVISKNKLWKILDLTTTLNGFFYKLDGGTFSIFDQGKTRDVTVTSDDNFSWNASEMIQLMLPHSISVQATGRYNAAKVITQGKRKASYMLDAGVKKTFFDKKLSLSLNCRNVLDSRKDRQKTHAVGYVQDSESWRGGRRFMLQISYSFGNMQGRKGDRKGNDNEGGQDYNGEGGEDF